MQELGIATVEFVGKIEELVVKAQEPRLAVEEVLGSTYVNEKWIKVKPEKCETVELNSLRALVEFVRTTVATNDDEFKFPLQIKVSHYRIELLSSLDKDLDRNTIATVTPINPAIVFDRFMSKEQFIIQLQTCFVETDNKIALLEQVRYLSDETKVETMDDGISQQVTAQKGVALRKDIQLQPIVRLVAYRTYKEVAQPETMYLLRAQDGGQLALFEADGGMWKYEAACNVVEYLQDELDGEIVDGLVVVIG